ncbi:hypothetical protein [Propionivibrio limicola]|uniref:hypothetical protein n=1 Tax=Propionivibrio limicola TaxID=167645 RepID=UPI001290A1F0|nr:hypothetical protein [Propionivibrio limicola]
MLLDRYEPLFFNANFKEQGSAAGVFAYRGELILQEGEVADAQGRRKPPVSLLRQAIALASGEQLQLLAGSLDQLQDFQVLLEKCGADIQPGAIVVLFVVNIPKAFVSTVNGVSVAFYPLVQGLVWSELCEMAALEKADFKGQGATDKVVTLFEGLKNYKYKLPEMSLDEAMKTTNDAKRETHGAI